jgi:hypothetical protein
MKPPKFLAIGQDVLVVGHTGKAHRARIIEVITPTAARCESLDGKASSISRYSESGEINTFHFPPEEAGPAVVAGVSPAPNKPTASATASATARK